MTKDEFLKDVGNWSNHRYLLWPTLEATKHLKLPVLELGCGDGSTPFLQQYCRDNGLRLMSYDSNREWAKKFGATYTDWSMFGAISAIKYSVALIDEAPGEHRRESIKMVNAEVIVIHDSEPAGWNASDYRVRPLFNRFKYIKDHQSMKPGAWATALSNTIDVTKL